jgi:hypothetical protein
MYENSSSDEIVSAILDKYAHLPEVTKEEVLECFEDIESLIEAKFLFTN